MLFRDVVGHTDTVKRLQQMLDSDRLPHALLLLGPEGCGKLTLALALAQAILCADRKPGEDACGTCSQCHKASRYIHPDLHFSFPTVGSKATSDEFLKAWREALDENPYQNGFQWIQRIGKENQQGNITKSECVRIAHKIGLKIYEGSHKVLILWLPEYLGNEGNRLLKLLEEPPENTVFILVAEQVDLILNTILSRCQLFRLPALSDTEVTDALVQLREVPRSKAEAAAFLSGGNLNEALQLLEEGVNDNHALFLEWMRQCYLGKPEVLVEWSQKLGGLGREKQKQLLQYGLHFLRELISLKTRGKDAVRLQSGELETAVKMNPLIPFWRLEAFTELFTDYIYHIERNAHARLQFLACGIRIHHLFKLQEHELRRMHAKT